MSQLEDMKARVEVGKYRPWEVRADHEEPPAVWHDGEIAFPVGRCADCGVEAVYSPSDAELIAAAPSLLAALEAVEALAEEAMSESAYLLPGGYPSKPVEARLILTVISEALQ